MTNHPAPTVKPYQASHVPSSVHAMPAIDAGSVRWTSGKPWKMEQPEMDYMPVASGFLLDLSCESCEFPIISGDPVYWTADSVGSGDDQRILTRVRHAECHRYISHRERQAAEQARLEAYSDLLGRVTYQTRHELVEGVTFLRERSRLALQGHSGLDLAAWLTAKDDDVRLVQGGRA